MAFSKGNYFQGLKESSDAAPNAQMENLKGVTLRVGILEGNHDYDYDCKAVFQNGHLKSEGSYSQYILGLLQEVLQFDVKYIPSTSWGYLKNETNWTGLAGLLANNSTDLDVCHWTTAENLSEIADHLFSTLHTTEAFVYLPQNLPLTQDVFVKTFSKNLWFCFFLSIFLLVVSFRFSTSMHSSVRPDHEPWSWAEVVLFAVAAISQQSYSRHPRGSSCRTMFLMGYIVTYLLYTGFAAGITSLLALQGHQNHLTFQDIANEHLNLLFHSDEYSFNFLKNFPDSKDIYSDLLKRNEVVDLTQIFSKIKEKNNVGFGSTITFVNHLKGKAHSRRQGALTIFQIPHSLREKGFLVQKTFPYKHIFNYWLLRLKENGLMNLGMKRFLKMDEIATYKSTVWLSADLRNVFSALMILAGGWILSVVVLFAEIIWERRSRARNRSFAATYHSFQKLELNKSMFDDHSYILHGPKVPLEVPNISLGQFMYLRLSSQSSNNVLMREADNGRFITSSEFLILSIKVAKGLKSIGLLPGNTVAILGKAGIDVYATSTGTLFQGGTVFPLDHTLASDAFRQLLKTVEPKFVFCDVEVVDKIAETLDQFNNPAPIVLFGASSEYAQEEASYRTFESFVKTEVDLDEFLPVASDDMQESLAFLVCSSGTTGVPKPVMLTDKNVMFQVAIMSFMSSYNKFLTCPAITFSYFFWISGILLYMSAICLDFEIIIVQKLDAKHILNVIEKYKPIWGMFSPLLVKHLTYHPEFKSYNVSSLSLMLTGGCSLQKLLVDKIKDLWGDHLSCRQAYGMTEIAGSVTTSGMDDDVLSVGKLLPGFQLKIVAMNGGGLLGPGVEGEVFLKSPSLMKGYLKNEEATKGVIEDGWYRTGDLGYYTDQGAIYITGRMKDFIRFNNNLISPGELEEVIMAVPGVLDVGVAGIKVDENNHLPMAIVVRKPGSGVTEEDIIKSVNESLPEHKQLRAGVCFVDVIPRTPSGKMKRLELLNLAKSLYMEE